MVTSLARGGACPAIEADGQIRDGAWLAEATHLVDLSACTVHAGVGVRGIAGGSSGEDRGIFPAAPLGRRTAPPKGV